MSAITLDGSLSGLRFVQWRSSPQTSVASFLTWSQLLPKLITGLIKLIATYVDDRILVIKLITSATKVSNGGVPQIIMDAIQVPQSLPKSIKVANQFDHERLPKVITRTIQVNHGGFPSCSRVIAKLITG